MNVSPWDEIASRLLRPSGAALGARAVGPSLEGITSVLARSIPTSRDTESTPRASLGSVSHALSGGATVLSSVAQAVLPGASQQGGGVMSAVASGLGLGPLITGLISLFGGGGKSEPPPLLHFQLPASVNRIENLGSAGSAATEVNYSQNGLPRVSGGGVVGIAPPSQVTVQVRAMDSKSFLDHSEDIARAVRDAMLYSHSLNDVVTEL